MLLAMIRCLVLIWLMVETRPLDGSFWAGLALAAKVHALNWYHLLPGVPLGIGYLVPPAGHGTGLVLMGAAATLSLAVLAAMGAKRGGTLAIAGLGAALWLLFYLPVSHLLVTIQTPMADRYLTLPSMAAALLAAAALARLSSRPMRLGVLALFCLVASGASLAQARTWSSPRALYEQVLALHPDAPGAHIQLARLDSERWRLDLAEQAFKRAHQLQPDHADNLYNLAAVAHRKGDLQAARSWARQALKLKPSHLGAQGMLKALGKF